MSHDSYFDANRRHWDQRAPVHAASQMYDLAAFAADPEHLSDVVRFDAPVLGTLTGQRAVHLQCHIGTDTLSLQRLGAEVAGVDQSAASIGIARQLFQDTATAGRFEIGNVYDAPALLGETYDLVYSGVGALNWLPDVRRWAQTAAALLAPGGRLYLREGHPMLWAMEDRADSELRVHYPYFETTEPMVWDDTVTYTGPEEVLTETRNYEWNHGLGEIVTAVIDAGMRVDRLDEHQGCEWQAMPHMVLEGRQWMLPPEQRSLLPLMYTLQATKL
ncbi:MAG: class I SAM-dependent methyltransferase [Pseudomonadota bacterium]